MALHLAARLHAFVHGLFRSSDELETRELFDKVNALFRQNKLSNKEARLDLVYNIVSVVLVEFQIDPQHPQAKVIIELILDIFNYEGFFILPNIDWRERKSVSAYWELRDQINVQLNLIEDFYKTKTIITLAIIGFLEPIYSACPSLLSSVSSDTDITVSTDLVRNFGDIGEVTEAVLINAFDLALEDAGLFARLSTRLELNLVIASGGNPADPRAHAKAFKTPTKSDIKDAKNLATTYLNGTPLLRLFLQKVDFSIPTESRFEHHHIIAGSGHGKTQTLQYLIAKDLKAVAKGQRSVIVLDSQGDLIRNISNMAEFAEGGPLHDKVIIIDPTDVEWPVSLNLFDVGIERLQNYAPLERERLTNSILELYDFVLGTLLSAEMTQKQNVIFRYVTRLMLHIPNATIHTLRELMEPNSQIKFAKDIAKLSGTAKRFFETEFASKEFEQTKKQVLRRLWGILENQTFERMFSHPKTKLDLFTAMNTGKVILINTAKDLLKEQGSQIFGRFFIAMISQAAQERAILPENKRMPTFVYIDEASDYFDRNIGIILSQARKYNVGMILAHQYLGQLDVKLQEAFAANTSIKFAGGVSARDARTLSQMLYCDPNLIESQPKGSFAAYIRGVTKSALPLSFPFGYLENQPSMTSEQRKALQKVMRRRHAVYYTELDIANGDIKSGEAEELDTTKKPDDVSTDAGSEW